MVFHSLEGFKKSAEVHLATGQALIFCFTDYRPPDDRKRKQICRKLLIPSLNRCFFLFMQAKNYKRQQNKCFDCIMISNPLKQGCFICSTVFHWDRFLCRADEVGLISYSNQGPGKKRKEKSLQDNRTWKLEPIKAHDIICISFLIIPPCHHKDRLSSDMRVHKTGRKVAMKQQGRMAERNKNRGSHFSCLWYGHELPSVAAEWFLLFL